MKRLSFLAAAIFFAIAAFVVFNIISGTKMSARRKV
jgi:hypothetical protein